VESHEPAVSVEYDQPAGGHVADHQATRGEESYRPNEGERDIVAGFSAGQHSAGLGLERPHRQRLRRRDNCRYAYARRVSDFDLCLGDVVPSARERSQGRYIDQVPWKLEPQCASVFQCFSGPRGRIDIKRN
jgi:hypothetical protein